MSFQCLVLGFILGGAVGGGLTLAFFARILSDGMPDDFTNNPTEADTWRSLAEEKKEASMKKYSLNDALFDETGQRWVPAPVAQALYKALKKIDGDLEGRNFLENSSIRDTARAALAAADGESDE